MTETPGSGHCIEVRARAEAEMEGAGAQPLEFAAVYRECFTPIWRKLARLGVPASQLDDVTQEVFVAIHRQLTGLRDPTRLKAWTTGFAIRAASDVRRNLRRRGAHEEVREDLPASNRTDARLERRQGLELLQAVLAQLSDDLREVFVLIELEEMSGPQVAAALEINLNTVYSRLRLARVAFNELVTQLRGQS